MTEDGYGSLIKLAVGDMRKALNLLQSTSMGFPVVDTRAVYLCAGHPLPADITAVVEAMLTLPLADAIHRACVLASSGWCFFLNSFYKTHLARYFGAQDEQRLRAAEHAD